MRKYTLFLLLFTVFSLFKNEAIAQAWTPIGPNDNESGIEQTFEKVAIAIANDGTQYAAYYDGLNTKNVYVVKYNGTIWEVVGGAAVTATTAIYANVSLIVDGSTPYVSYVNDDDNTLTVQRFFNGAWEPVGFSIFNADYNYSADGLKKSGDTLYIAYVDIVSGQGKASVRSFDLTNPGNDWQLVGPAGFGGNAAEIHLSVDNGIPFVFLRDPNTFLPSVIKYNEPIDGWEHVTGFSPSDNNPITSPSIAFDANHTLYISYADEGNFGAGVVRTLQGVNWIDVGNIAPQGTVGGVSITCINNVLFSSYTDVTTLPSPLTIKRWTGTDWEAVGAQPVSDPATAGSIFANTLVAGANNQLLVTYTDQNAHIRVKSFDASPLLPVSLMQFTASKKDKATVLEWTTATETNNAGFKVEHSINGNKFNVIATVTGKGNSHTQSNYHFKHIHPQQGTNYYRLVQVDNDGKSTVLGTKVVQFEADEITEKVLVSPNPAQNWLSIQHNLTDLREVQVLDLQGKVVLQQKLTEHQSLERLDVSTLKPGAYFLKLYHLNGSKVQKIIKQ